MPNPSIRRPPGPRPHFLIGNFPLGRADPLAVFRLGAGIRRYLLLSRRVDSRLFSEFAGAHRIRSGHQSAEFPEGSRYPKQPLVSRSGFADERRRRVVTAAQAVPACISSRTACVVCADYHRVRRGNAGVLERQRKPRRPSGDDAAHAAGRRQGAIQRRCGRKRVGKSLRLSIC